MKTQLLRVASMLVLTLLAPSTELRAQELASALDRFASRDYYTRQTAFNQVLDLARKESISDGRSFGARLREYVAAHPEVGSALIALLELEAIPDPAKERLPEDGYIGALIAAVAGLRDSRAVNACLASSPAGRLPSKALRTLALLPCQAF